MAPASDELTRGCRLCRLHSLDQRRIIVLPTSFALYRSALDRNRSRLPPLARIRASTRRTLAMPKMSDKYGDVMRNCAVS